jgi:hypothetical protein
MNHLTNYRLPHVFFVLYFYHGKDFDGNLNRQKRCNYLFRFCFDATPCSIHLSIYPSSPCLFVCLFRDHHRRPQEEAEPQLGQFQPRSEPWFDRQWRIREAATQELPRNEAHCLH